MKTLTPQLLSYLQFGSIGMLAFGVAAALPILIHLLSRRKYREEPWAAMAFLLAALRKNARRIQLEQWLLLAVRTAILLLFALALADPQWSGRLPSAAGEEQPGPAHVVLVIDGSYSMDCRSRDKSHFAAAKAAAKQIVTGGQPGDGYTLIVMSQPPRAVITEPATDASEVLAEIDSLELTHTGASLPATLAEIETVLHAAAKRFPQLVQSRVFIFTDLQRLSWGEASSPDCQARLARLEKVATLDLFDLGEPRTDNLAVARLEIDQSLVAAHLDVQIQVDVQSFAENDRPGQTWEVFVDGARIAADQVAVPAGGSATVNVRHRFDVPGEHLVEARLGDDLLPLDNRRWLSVPVAPAIRVLCIGGHPGETRHLALALAPAKQPPGPIEVVEATESRLIEEDLATFDCLFLCNIGRFSRREASLLADYVHAGGGLVFFLGDQVQVENYNELLARDAPTSVLPAQLDGLAATGKYPLNPLDYGHPIVSPFRGFERAGLLTTPIWKYIRTVPAERAKTVAAFPSGDPAIVEKSVGRGRCILVTTAASPDSVDAATNPPTPWAAWSAWPSFPPLVHEMLRFAIAGRSADRNLLVGEGLVGSLPPATVGDETAMLTLPDGTRERLTLDHDRGQPIFAFDETVRVGPYQVQARSGVRLFAVNLHPRESDLSRLPRNKLPAALRSEAFAEPAEPKSPTIDAPAALYRWLLGAVGILLIAEPCLAWWLARGRT